MGYLFAGIFMTIIPALAILKAGEHGALAPLIAMTDAPPMYFWVTGSLSSFLDNAPTYLTFFNTALGGFYAGLPEPEAVALLIEERSQYLLAISTGAVFMGAMTYIGNAAQFHGQEHRRGGRHPHAQLLRLHDQVLDTDTPFRYSWS